MIRLFVTCCVVCGVTVYFLLMPYKTFHDKAMRGYSPGGGFFAAMGRAMQRGRASRLNFYWIKLGMLIFFGLASAYIVATVIHWLKAARWLSQ